MPDTTKPIRRLRRIQEIGASRLPEWDALERPHRNPTVDACRQLLALYGRLGAREFAALRFFDEDPFDEQRALDAAREALRAIEPLLTEHHGSQEIQLGTKSAGSPFEAVYFIAHDLLRAVAEIAPDAPLAGDCMAGDEPLPPGPSLGTVRLESLAEVYRAVASMTPESEPSTERQDRTERKAAEIDARRACVAVVLHRGDGLPMSSERIAEQIKADSRLWGFAREHGWCPSRDTIKKLGMRDAGLAAGSPGSKAQLASLTDEGKEWLQRTLAKYGREEFIE